MNRQFKTENDIMKMIDNLKKKFSFKLFTYNGPPHHSEKLIMNYQYEVNEQALLNEYLLPDDRVLELGGNIGTSSILIDKILNNKKQHVTVEPNLNIVKTLKRNKDLHNCNFEIVPGIISKPREVYINGDGWGGGITTYFQSTGPVKTFDFHELDKKYNFNVLFADCEGGMVQLIQDYPSIHKNLRLVIYERDGEYSTVDKYFIDNNFKKVFSYHDDTKEVFCVFEKSKNNSV